MMQIDLLEISKFSCGNIPTGTLEEARELICSCLTDCVNSAICDCRFPEELKIADLTPVYKNDNPGCVGKFRPISVLPAVSKMYE